MKKETILGIVILVLAGIGVTVLLTSTSPTSSGLSVGKGEPYTEIVNPSGFVNTEDEPITIGQYIGKKVILLDVMTYSCINCQRTFPYITAWYNKYKDDGLIVIGIHTPEFAFEKDKTNVAEAMERFGITFPVVLDNEYSTWNALKNHFWPHKYLIDIHGNVVYDHAGEGKYEEIEKKIRELLKERATVLGEADPFVSDKELAVALIEETRVAARSPETYFGSDRNEYLTNGSQGRAGVQTFILPETPVLNALYFGGTWNIAPEQAESVSESKIQFRYNAEHVYFVADADMPIDVEVWQDGQLVATQRGADVSAEGSVTIKESRLYELIRNEKAGEHLLELRIKGAGLHAYTFTFG